MPDNRFASVSGIVIKENQVLLARQNYGAAKGLLVIPGGYISEDEMPNIALEREIFEETGIIAKTKDLLAIRFSKKDWWAIFSAEYVSGEVVADENEISEAFFMDIEKALLRDDLTYTTKEILENYKTKPGFQISGFYPKGVDPNDYQLYY